MTSSAFSMLSGISLAAICLLAGMAAAEDRPDIPDYLGCWESVEPATTAIITDGSSPDGYKLEEEYMALVLRTVEGGVPSRNLVKGHWMLWNDQKRYFVPEVYVFGTFDPAGRGLSITSPGFGYFFVKLDGERMLLNRLESTDKFAGLALRILDRTDCHEMDGRLAAIKDTYSNASDTGSPAQMGLPPK